MRSQPYPARRRRRKPRLPLAVAAALFVVGLIVYAVNPNALVEAGILPSPTPTATSAAPSPTTTAPDETPTPSQPAPVTTASTSALANGLTLTDPAEATTVLAEVAVKKNSMAGYDRDEQFPHWLSASKWGWDMEMPTSGCDAREATLIRDGADVQVGENCVVESGVWVGPYGEGEVFTDTSDIQIDHLVPLANAYRSGANAWTQEQGRVFANDPLVVVISKGSINQSKGDQGPDTWKPQRVEEWCNYSLRWVEIKHTYGLNLVNESERTALTEMLNTCQE